MNRVDQAVDCLSRGFNCAQSVFSTYAPLLGFDSTDALRVSCGFGGGMGRLQMTCGAVTAAFMLIGCKHGKTKEDDTRAKERTYEFVRRFAKRFEKKNGTLSCRELIGCDLNTSEGRRYAKENNLFETKCKKYIGDSGEIIEEMLFERE